MIKQVLLNFDLEEFDIPEEYGQKVDPSNKISVTSEGCNQILDLLEKLNIPATFFTTSYFAQNNSSLIHRLVKKHELASHNVSHSNFAQDGLSKSRLELEKISGKKIYGFRQPLFKPVDQKEVLAAGYTYNSSENPIWLPGRYMRLFKPRLPYFSGDLLNLPISTSPIIRYPLFWLSFKNSPLWLFKAMSWWSLQSDCHLNIFFHPWEFTDLSMWHLPGYVKNPSGAQMLKKLELYLLWLKNKASFTTCLDFSERFQLARNRINANIHR